MIADDKEQVSAHFRETVLVHGGFIGAAEYEKSNLTPSYRLVRKYFKSFIEAYIYSGFFVSRDGKQTSKRMSISDFQYKKHIAKELGIEATTLNHVLNNKKFDAFVFECQGSIYSLLTNQGVQEVKKYVQELREQWNNLKHSKEYITWGELRHRTRVPNELLLEMIENGELGEVIQIPRITKDRSTAFDNVNYFFKMDALDIVKDRFSYQTLHAISEQKKIDYRKLRTFELKGWLPDPISRQTEKGTLDLYKTEDILISLQRHENDYKNLTKEKVYSSRPEKEPRFRILPKHLQQLIDEYLRFRQSGNLVIYNGYTSKRKIANPEITLEISRSNLANAFYWILCARYNLVPSGPREILSDKDQEILKQCDFDVESIGINDYYSISNVRATSTLTAYFHDLRAFYFWILQKKENIL